MECYNDVVHQALHFFPVEPVTGLPSEGPGVLGVLPTGVDLGGIISKDDPLLSYLCSRSLKIKYALIGAKV